MRKSLEIPDPIYRQVKTCAVLRGESVKAFLLKAIEDKVCTEEGGSWWASGRWKVTESADQAKDSALESL